MGQRRWSKHVMHEQFVANTFCANDAAMQQHRCFCCGCWSQLPICKTWHMICCRNSTTAWATIGADELATC
eukprot:9082-Heterococcus_DN1.PRE.2